MAGLKRVAKICGGITIRIKGKATKYDGNGNIIDEKKDKRRPKK